MENATLKRMYAELALDNARIKGLQNSVTLGKKREVARFVIGEHGQPAARACDARATTSWRDCSCIVMELDCVSLFKEKTGNALG